jgi:hypothetical protein
LATSCAALARPFKAALGYSSIACVDSEETWCTCSANIEQDGGMAFVSATPLTSGNFTAASGILAVTDGTSEAQYTYCVVEDTLTLSRTRAGPTGVVIGTVVLQRQ